MRRAFPDVHVNKVRHKNNNVKGAAKFFFGGGAHTYAGGGARAYART